VGLRPRSSLKHALVADPGAGRGVFRRRRHRTRCSSSRTPRQNVEDVLSIRDRQIRAGSWCSRQPHDRARRALDLLIARFRPFGYTPYLREEAGGVAVQAWPVADTAPRWRIWVNLALFALTVVSTLAAGLSFVGSPTFDALLSTSSAVRFLAGAPFAFTFLAILGVQGSVTTSRRATTERR
jgi:hypothetical protein